jgi:hypothetical protein
MRYAIWVVGVLFVALFVFFVGARNDMTTDRAILIGKWVSTQDTKFTREFKGDGTVIDTYEGSTPNSQGHWTLFTKDMPVEGFTGDLEEKSIYLSIAAPQSEALFFKISKIDSANLELVYFNRGGTLSFTKVK